MDGIVDNKKQTKGNSVPDQRRTGTGGKDQYGNSGPQERPWNGENPDKYLTEIQIPVERLKPGTAQ